MVWFRGSSIILLAALMAAPLLLGGFASYQLGLFLLYGVVGQGIALCWGRAGFLPLGQSVFFGLAAYLSGFTLKAFGADWSPALLGLLVLSAAAPAVLAYFIGLLVFARRRKSGPYFSLITLALTMLAFQIANGWSGLTGGFNGISGIPGLPGLDSFGSLYYVIAAAVLLSSLALWLLSARPLGVLLSAISQNEERLQHFGFATGHLKAVAFGVSAFLAGIAGVLYAPHQGIVTPQAVGFLLSAELVIWTAVGGRGSVMGPLAGAVAIGFLSFGLRERFEYWEAVVAVVFILVVLRLPGGIAGLVEARLPKRMRRHRATARTVVAPPPSGRQPPPSFVFDRASVRLGDVTILDRLSLEVSRPGVNCLIGPNGAGKTSMFNAITGRLPVTAGRIGYGGGDVTGRSAVAMARMGVGRKFQNPSVFADLSVGENLDIALWANRLPPWKLLNGAPFGWNNAIFDTFKKRFAFLGDESARAGSLSQGQRQMLELTMAFIAEPRLILLDEPCAGLSPDETRSVVEAIREAVDILGTTALVIEHDMSLVERIADRVYVLHQGRKLAEGSLAEIRADAAVEAVYAGGTK